MSTIEHAAARAAADAWTPDFLDGKRWPHVDPFIASLLEIYTLSAGRDVREEIAADARRLADRASGTSHPDIATMRSRGDVALAFVAFELRIVPTVGAFVDEFSEEAVSRVKDYAHAFEQRRAALAAAEALRHEVGAFNDEPDDITADAKRVMTAVCHLYAAAQAADYMHTAYTSEPGLTWDQRRRAVSNEAGALSDDFAAMIGRLCRIR
jgi:hypothetical protein